MRKETASAWTKTSTAEQVARQKTNGIIHFPLQNEGLSARRGALWLEAALYNSMRQQLQLIFGPRAPSIANRQSPHDSSQPDKRYYQSIGEETGVVYVAFTLL